MKLTERLTAAIKRLTRRSASQAVSLSPKGEGTAASGKGTAAFPKGSSKTALGPKATMPKGTAKQPVSAAVVPKGTAERPVSTASAPKGTAEGTSKEKTAAVPKASGETAPKNGSAAVPKGSAQGTQNLQAAMPEGTAKRPSSAAAAVPKGTAEAAPVRLRAAQVKGSAQAALAGGKTAMPMSSWQNLPQTEVARQTEIGGGGFSVLTQETILSGPPADPARQLSELLRVQRRMNPGATTFGEEVL